MAWPGLAVGTHEPPSPPRVPERRRRPAPSRLPPPAFRTLSLTCVLLAPGAFGMSLGRPRTCIFYCTSWGSLFALFRPYLLVILRDGGGLQFLIWLLLSQLVLHIAIPVLLRDRDGGLCLLRRAFLLAGFLCIFALGDHATDAPVGLFVGLAHHPDVPLRLASACHELFQPLHPAVLGLSETQLHHRHLCLRERRQWDWEYEG